MKRVLPAHIVTGAAAAGLVLSDLVRVGLGLAAIGALAAGAAVLAFRSLPAPLSTRLLAGAAVVAATGWWWGSARLNALDRSPLAAHVDEAGWFDVDVTAEPRVGRFDQRIFAVVHRFRDQSMSERTELELPLGRAPPQGARMHALAVVRSPPSPGPGSGGFDERRWLRRQGIHVVLHVDRWSVTGHRGGIAGVGDHLRAWLKHASAPGVSGERRAVLEGIVLGDDAGLSPDLKNAFRRSGLYHLLAVSGENVVLIAGGMLLLGVLLGLPRSLGHVGALGAIAAYVLAVGPQASVLRAAISGAAVSIAWLAGRGRDSWHVFLLAAAVLLGWSPYALFDPGFQLSFAAVAAIFLIAPWIRVVLEGYPLPAGVRTGIAISAACSLATAPVLALSFGNVPLLGVVANLLAAPVVGLLLGLALSTAVIDVVSPSLAGVLARLAGWLAAYLAVCARAVSALPFAQLTGRAAVVATVLALLCAAYAWRSWRTH